MVDWWLRSRKQVAKNRQKAFNLLVFLVAWSLWLERNIRVFNRSTSLVAAMLVSIQGRVELWSRVGLLNRSELIGE
jgi:hypothetical protein